MYGNDISSTTNPIDAGLSWITDLNKDNFLGKTLLLDIKNKGPQRKLIGFKMLDKAIPRQDYSIYIGTNAVGKVTSGTHSPTLSYGIGLGYIQSNYTKIGQQIKIEIRGKLLDAEIVKTPFLKNTSIYNYL